MWRQISTCILSFLQEHCNLRCQWPKSSTSLQLPRSQPTCDSCRRRKSFWWRTNGQKTPRSLPRYPLPSQHDNRKFLQKEEHYQKGSSSHEAACWPDVLTTISPPNSWAILIVFSLCPPRHSAMIVVSLCFHSSSFGSHRYRNTWKLLGSACIFCLVA